MGIEMQTVAARVHSAADPQTDGQQGSRGTLNLEVTDLKNIIAD